MQREQDGDLTVACLSHSWMQIRLAGGCSTAGLSDVSLHILGTCHGGLANLICILMRILAENRT